MAATTIQKNRRKQSEANSTLSPKTTTSRGKRACSNKPLPIIQYNFDEEEQPEDESDENEQTRCPCQETHNDGLMIQCEACLVWQHCVCVGLKKRCLPKKYWCEQCKPVNHPYFKLKALETQASEKRSSRNSSLNPSSSSVNSPSHSPSNNTQEKPFPSISTTTSVSSVSFKSPVKKRNTMTSREACQWEDIALIQILSEKDLGGDTINNLNTHDQALTEAAIAAAVEAATANSRALGKRSRGYSPESSSPLAENIPLSEKDESPESNTARPNKRTKRTASNDAKKSSSSAATNSNKGKRKEPPNSPSSPPLSENEIAQQTTLLSPENLKNVYGYDDDGMEVEDEEQNTEDEDEEDEEEEEEEEEDEFIAVTTTAASRRRVTAAKTSSSVNGAPSKSSSPVSSAPAPPPQKREYIRKIFKEKFVIIQVPYQSQGVVETSMNSLDEMIKLSNQRKVASLKKSTSSSTGATAASSLVAPASLVNNEQHLPSPLEEGILDNNSCKNASSTSSSNTSSPALTAHLVSTPPSSNSILAPPASAKPTASSQLTEYLSVKIPTRDISMECMRNRVSEISSFMEDIKSSLTRFPSAASSIPTPPIQARFEQEAFVKKEERKRKRIISLGKRVKRRRAEAEDESDEEEEEEDFVRSYQNRKASCTMTTEDGFVSSDEEGEGAGDMIEKFHTIYPYGYLGIGQVKSEWDNGEEEERWDIPSVRMDQGLFEMIERLGRSIEGFRERFGDE